jgi:transposase
VGHAKKHDLVWPLPPEMTNERLRELFSPSAKESGYYKEPDYEWIHNEMAKSGVTLTLLWNEYSARCRQNDGIPYMYTAFCDRYRDYSVKNKATMRIERKPGEQMEVDWAGQTMEIADNLTGEIIPAYIFVAALSYSGYAYVEAFMSRNQGDWIAAHVNAYRFFGGSTRILVPDNLKTGVLKNTKAEVVLNRTYHEMAEHYGTAVLPARVRKPKDKPSVEGAVGVISTWIIAALRNWKFFTVQELNEAIGGKLEEFHQKPFQKRQGSRLSVFLEEEKPQLLPLPRREFELAQWKICTVAYNYHVSVDRMYYSVPYDYIKKQVDARFTRDTVEVFYNGGRVASHVRKHGHPGQYSTLPEHMPEDHRKYTQWNSECFFSWARGIGENTLAVVKAILDSRTIEQQGYRACMALLKLSDKYSASRLEAACKLGLSYTLSPSFRSIQTILATGQDELSKDEPTDDASAEFGFTRGSGYYGGDA